MFRKLLIFLGVCIVLLCLTLAGLGYFLYTQQDTIADRLMVELNKNLLTKVEVNGKVELSLLSHFPYAALELNDVIIMGSTGFPDDTLISARSLYLTASVLDLLNQEWRIREVDLRHGWMHMVRSPDGTINYQFVPNNTGTTTQKPPTPFLLRIETAYLEDIRFSFIDHPGATFLDVQGHKLTFSGNFSPEKLSLDISGAATTNKLEIKETDYAPNRDIQLKGKLVLSPKENTYDITTDLLKIGENNFGIDGSFTVLKDGTAFDLVINGIDLNLARFITLLPDKINDRLTGYKPSGDLDFSTTIRGELTNTSNPSINVEYQLVNGQVVHTDKPFKIDELVLRGSFSNGDKQTMETSQIELYKLVLGAEGQQLTGSFSAYNLNTPKLLINLEGSVDLAIFQPLLPDTLFSEFSGVVDLNSLSFDGPAEDLELINTPETTLLKFDARFHEVSIGTNDLNFQLNSGHINLSPWTIKLDTLTTTIDGNQFTTTGKIVDWKGYLYSLLNQPTDPVKALFVDLDISAGDIIIPETDTTSSTSIDTYSPDWLTMSNISGDALVHINSLSQDKLHVSNINTNLHFAPGEVNFKGLEAQLFGGNVAMNGQIHKDEHFEAVGNLYQINISQLFEGFNNFDQEDLTGKNISGTLSTTFSMSGSFVNNTWHEDAFHLLADITIENGALVNFKAMESLGKFIDMDELMNIQFETLKNQIEVKNRVVNIPQMIIKSNALNLSLSGSHSFDNIVDYSIKLNIYDVLASRFRKRNPNNQFYEVIDDNSFNFFISITGPLDDPTIKYDKQGVKDRFKKQGGELRNAIQGVYDDYNADKEQRDWEIPDEAEYLDWNDTIP